MKTPLWDADGSPLETSTEAELQSAWRAGLMAAIRAVENAGSLKEALHKLHQLRRGEKL